MRYFYIFGFFCAVLIAVYVAGIRIGGAKCRTNAMAQSMNTYVQLLKNKEKINENVLHTNLDDIRRWLREKYTIAE